MVYKRILRFIGAVLTCLLLLVSVKALAAPLVATQGVHCIQTHIAFIFPISESINPLFQNLLTLLAELRFLRLFTKHCSTRWASFVTLFGQKSIVWGWLHRKLGKFLKPRAPGPSFSDSSTRVHPAPSFLRDWQWEYVVTASNMVPTSASHGRINPDQPSLAISSASIDRSSASTPAQEQDQRDALHHGSTVHSLQSSTSDRLSGITSSHDSWHSPLRQPS